MTERAIRSLIKENDISWSLFNSAHGKIFLFRYEHGQLVLDEMEVRNTVSRITNERKLKTS